ncbi:AAA-like domain-containing protein [Microcoleus sp. F8_C2]
MPFNHENKPENNYENTFLEAETLYDLYAFFDHIEQHKEDESEIDKRVKAYFRGVLLRFTHDEIAKELGTTSGTVQQSLSAKLAKPIKLLLKIPDKYLDWSRVPDLLTKAGYAQASGANNRENLAFLDSSKAQPQESISTPIEKDVEELRYLERSKIESRYEQEISRPGCLLRLKAPWHMGKTTLINKLINKAKGQGYFTVYLSFKIAPNDVLNDLDRLLRWFSACITKQLMEQGIALQLPENLSSYWDETFGSKLSCKYYLNKKILIKISSVLLVVVEDIDLVCETPKIADDFLDMLRDWREEANKINDWKKLRLIITYSRKIITSSIYKSPFNVAETELPEFEYEEVCALVQKYELNCDSSQIQQLIGIVGGYPFLIQQALVKIYRSEITFDELLKTDPTDSRIYSNHLEEHLLFLQTHAELEKSMKRVVDEREPVKLDWEQANQLYSMGLVKLERIFYATPRCQLYRQYFQECLK